MRRLALVAATLGALLALASPTAAVADDAPTAQAPAPAVTCDQPYQLTFTQTLTIGRVVNLRATVTRCDTGAPVSGKVAISLAGATVPLAGHVLTASSGSWLFAGVALPAADATVPLVVTYTSGDQTTQSWPVTAHTGIAAVTLAVPDTATVVPGAAPGTVRLSATVSAVVPAGLSFTFPLPVPTGAVDFLRDGKVAATATLVPGTSTNARWATARASLTGIPRGTVLTVRYRGDSSYPAATAGSPITVVDPRPTTRLTIDPPTVAHDRRHLWVDANLVEGAGPEVDEPSSVLTATITVDGVATGAVSLIRSGPGHWSSSAYLPVTLGKHAVGLTFAGDTTLEPSSATRSVDVEKLRTTVALGGPLVGTGDATPGERVRLEACVTDSAHATTDATVRFQRRVAGAKAWSTFATSKASPDTCLAKTSVVQKASSVYRAVVVGDATYVGSTSTSATVKTDRRVTVGHKAAKKKSQFVITAKASPSGTFRLQELTAHRWVTRATKTPKAAVGAAASVAFTVTKSTRGSRVFRVVVPTNAQAQGGTSSDVIVPTRH